MGLFPFGPVATIVQVAPSGDVTGVSDAARINAAVASVAGQPNAYIRFGPGHWYIRGGQVIINRSSLWLDMTGCYVTAVGAGDCIRMFDSSTYSTRVGQLGGQGGGILGMPIFDGTSTTGTSTAFHAGDILGLACFAQSQNFNFNATSKAFWFDNNYFWTEWLWGRCYAFYSASHYVFDNSANTSGQATGSFDRLQLQMNVVAAGNGDALTLQNGALIANGDFSLLGNMSTSFNASRYACIRITGNNALASSQITRSRMMVGVELDDNVNFNPVTITFGAAGNNIFECSGELDWSSGVASFIGSNNAGQFSFTGPVLGDAGLFPYGYAASNVQAGANSLTLFTNYVGVLRVSGAASFTGLIMQAGSADGQKITVINTGTGSLTFAAAGTSNVADGVSDVIATLTARTYTWSSGAALWYRDA